MGCGSSAAVRLAGIALANAFGELQWDAARIVRRAVSRAPSILGGSAPSMRKLVLALVRMPDSGWLIS